MQRYATRGSTAQQVISKITAASKKGETNQTMQAEMRIPVSSPLLALRDAKHVVCEGPVSGLANGCEHQARQNEQTAD